MPDIPLLSFDAGMPQVRASLPHRALLGQEPDLKRWLWQMASLQGKLNHMDCALRSIASSVEAARKRVIPAFVDEWLKGWRARRRS